MGLHFFIYPRLALWKTCLSIFIGAFWWGWWWGDVLASRLGPSAPFFNSHPAMI